MSEKSIFFSEPPVIIPKTSQMIQIISLLELSIRIWLDSTIAKEISWPDYVTGAFWGIERDIKNMQNYICHLFGTRNADDTNNSLPFEVAVVPFYDRVSIKSGMAGFFYEKKDYEKAEHFFLEALKDYAILAENNTEYLEALEIRQRGLGDFYGSLWRSFKYIAEKDPEKLEVLESRQKELGNYYARLWDDFKTGELFAKAEKYYKAACQTALQKGEAPAFTSRLNWTSLSNLYLENDEDQKAEACIKVLIFLNLIRRRLSNITKTP